MITEMQFEYGTDPCPTIEWNREMTTEEYMQCIELVLNFCFSLGVDVEFSYNGLCTHKSAENKISMNTRFGLKKFYHVLLHEAGHMLINNEMIDRDNHTQFLINYPGNVNKNNKVYAGEGGQEYKLTKMDRRRRMITIIHEELDAWRKGIDIAHMLGLPLSLYDFYSDATKGVESYVFGACEEGELKQIYESS